MSVTEKFPRVELGHVGVILNMIGHEALPHILDGKVKLRVDYGEHVVDLQTDPLKAIEQAQGISVEEHRSMGKARLTRIGSDLFLDGQRMSIFQPMCQQLGSVEGDSLRTDLLHKLNLNVNLREFLFENQFLIPDTLKKPIGGNPQIINFWGTIFKNAEGELYVCGMCWYSGKWHKSTMPVSFLFHQHHVAAVLEP
jgi:hypothetical protein